MPQLLPETSAPPNRRWRTARVFISSTFRDMQAERDHLVKVVMPRLRERLEPWRVHLVDIDLRWGVTRAQAENNQALGVCLEWVHACRPLFLGLIGHRYGWVLDALPEEIAWEHALQDSGGGPSITELEIRAGALQSQAPDRSVLAFRANEATQTVPEPDRSEIYVETDPERIARLERLKQIIRDRGLPLIDGYACRWDAQAVERSTGRRGRLVGLESFGEEVEELLWNALARELDLPAMPLDEDIEAEGDWLAAEDDDQAQFLEERLRSRQGRESIDRELLRIADEESERICLVSGAGGIGKSTVLAQLVTTLERERAGWDVLPHFVAAGRRSSHPADLLQRICRHIARLYRLSGAISEDPGELSQTFHRLLHQVPPGRRLVLLLDGLDQLDATGSAAPLAWLPFETPPRVRIFASCVEAPRLVSPVLDTLRKRPHVEVRVLPLTPAEQTAILQNLPSLVAKALDEEQQKLLLSNPASGNPLFLQTALEELRGFGSFERLAERIRAFPAGEGALEELFVQVFQRLEDEFGSELTRRLLAMIASSRHGLSEAELRALTTDVSAAGDLFALLRQLRPYSIQRGPLIDFYHRVVRDAVAGYYLPTSAAREAAHQRLADFFFEAPLARQSDELPWQLRALDDWPRLYMLLTHPDLLLAMWKRDPYGVFQSWEGIEQATPLRLADAYGSLLSAGRVREDLAHILVGLFHVRGLEEQAARLQEGVVAALRDRDDPLRLASELCWLADLRCRLGEYAQALSHLDDAERALAGLPDAALLEPLLARSLMLFQMGRNGEAFDACARAESLIAAGAGNDWDRSKLLRLKAMFFKSLGRLSEALETLRISQRLLQHLGDELMIAASLNDEAHVLRDLGRLEEAWAAHDEQEAICRRIGHRDGIALALAGKACILERRGHLDEALALHEAEGEIYRELGEIPGQIRSLNGRGNSLLGRGENEAAFARFEEQEALARRIEDRLGLAFALGGQARALMGLKRRGEAVTRLEESEGLLRTIGNPIALAQCLDDQALALRWSDQPVEALERLRQSEAVFRQAGRPYSLVVNLLNQAAIHLQDLDDPAAARPLLAEAETLARRHGYGGLLEKMQQMVEPGEES